MIIRFTQEADADLEYFYKSGNKKAIKKIKELLTSMTVDPFTGIGQPEPLKYNFSGTWSRRINKEHRLVYDVIGEEIFVLSLRGHYSK